MKKWMMLSLLVVLLAGCRSAVPGGIQTEIDWVDFIKWDGKEYIGINTGALADEQYVGEQLGTVQFKVADNVTNPSYKIKDGDAAFREKGTEIYAVEGKGDLIAVKDEQAINGYLIYYKSESTDYKWHFKDLPVDEVKRVEIYEAYTSEGINRIADIIDTEDVARFLDILKNSKEDGAFQPITDSGDLLYYEIVLYTDEPIAYKYYVQFDGTTYFWSPWDTAILSDEIKRFIPYN